MRGRRGRVVAGVPALLVLLALAGCTSPWGDALPWGRGGGGDDVVELPASPGYGSLEDVYAQDVDWRRCGNGTDCADVLLPLSYDDPDGPAVSVALKRLAATGDAQGTIVVNPGGPGESGVGLVASAPYIFGPEVLESYDVVGFDPRGVGASTAVRCLREGEEDPTGWEYDLQDEDDLAQLRSDYAALAQGCRDLSGDLLDHVDTAHAARDLDVIRALVGSDRLDYLGYSYGTLLGAVYAETFPDRVGRMVLDSAIDPALGYADLQREQVDGFVETFAQFLQHCHQDGACPLPAEPAEASATLLTLAEELDDAPLPSDGEDGELAGWEAIAAIQGAMYSSPLWTDLEDALTEVVAGDDGSALDLMGEQGAMGGYDDPNAAFAFPAVDCTDYPMTSTFDQAVANAVELGERSALFGQGSLAEVACVLWPVEASVERLPISAPGAEPILVVSALHDPATPHAWSRSLVDELDSATLLTYDGAGHGIYGGVSSCVDAAVDTFFLTGALPADDTVCTD